MCGNYNGDSSDDNLMPDGKPANNDTELGNSWKAEGDSDPGSVLHCLVPLHNSEKNKHQKIAVALVIHMNLSEKIVVLLVFILLLCSSMPRFSIHRCKPDERPNDKPNCNENEEEIYKSQCAASILSDLFKPCHSLIPPESFLGNCIYDMCEYDGMQSTLCDNIDAYAQACHSAGVTISWRNSTFCRKWKRKREEKTRRCAENVRLSWVTGGRRIWLELWRSKEQNCDAVKMKHLLDYSLITSRLCINIMNIYAYFEEKNGLWIYQRIIDIQIQRVKPLSFVYIYFQPSRALQTVTILSAQHHVLLLVPISSPYSAHYHLIVVSKAASAMEVLC